jgi:hypothetical protein
MMALLLLLIVMIDVLMISVVDITGSSSSQSTSHISYLFLYVLYLLLQPLILLLRHLVLLLQLTTVHLTASAQSPLQEVHRIPWLLGLLVQLHQDLGELVHCTCLFKVFLKLLLLWLDSSLHENTTTCDISFTNIIISMGSPKLYSRYRDNDE